MSVKRKQILEDALPYGACMSVATFYLTMVSLGLAFPQQYMNRELLSIFIFVCFCISPFAGFILGLCFRVLWIVFNELFKNRRK